jgi:hypothetical protein
MNPTDPGYIAGQYASGESLAIIAETHRRYGVAPEDIFAAVTRTLLARGPSNASGSMAIGVHTVQSRARLPANTTFCGKAVKADRA